MKTITKTMLFIFSVVILGPTTLFAQEVCFTDASKGMKAWIANSGKTLNDLSAKYEASSDPNKELIDYNGMRMPITAALIIEGEKYGRLADAQLISSIDSAKTCSGKTNIPRAAYDVARELLGLTTILPERATRIDFEELRRGKIAGGEKSIVRETGRTIDKIFNPFRW